MTRRLDESKVSEIERALTERFGDPLTEVRPMIAEGLTCEGCGCMKQLEEEETCNQCGVMQTELDEGGWHPAWQPPADPKKTWTDSTTGETRGYCQTCLGRGKIENSKGNLAVCYNCKGKRIVTRQKPSAV